MTDCPRLGKLFGGCKFEARYDRVSATGLQPGDAFWVTLTGPPEAFKGTPARTTYIADVCIRCGKMLNRRVTKPKGAA